MLNKTAEYALRTVVHLATHATHEPMRAPELSSAVNVPHNYLSKILHQLARDGVLTSRRGKNGGFQLARATSSITLADVVEPFDPINARRKCILGRTVCSDRTSCPAHDQWKAIGGQLAAFFHETTLDALIEPAGTRVERRPSPERR